MRKSVSALSTGKLHRMMMRAAKKDIPPRIPNTPYLQRCTNALLRYILRRKVYDELNPCVLLDDDLNNIKVNEVVNKVKTDLVDRDAELAKLVRTRTLGPEDLLDISHESFLKLAPHFSPGQLLRLVLNKASGSLGELLGQPEAGEIWELSERNIRGLPLRPQYIRGDEYAELLFRPVCSVCGRVTPQPLDVQFMERLCEACRQVPSNAMVAEDCILVHLSGLVPSSSAVSPNNRQERFCLAQDLRDTELIINKFKLAQDYRGLDEWRNERLEHVRKWKHLSQDIKVFLDTQDFGFDLRKELEREARECLVEKHGWCAADFTFSSHAQEQWDNAITESMETCFSNETQWKAFLDQVKGLKAASMAQVDSSGKAESTLSQE